MHGTLFAGLSALLMLTFRLSLSSRTMAVFRVGLLQEGFQAFSQGYFSIHGSISDVAVDLAGGLMGLMLMGWKSRNPVRTVHLDNQGGIPKLSANQRLLQASFPDGREPSHATAKLLPS